MISKITKLVINPILLLSIFVSIIPLPVSALDTQSYGSNDIFFYDPSDTTCSKNYTITSNLPTSVPEPHRSLFTQAASAYGVNPNYIAALFLSENGNIWKAFNTIWQVSPAGAAGPFQFLAGTWNSYRVDGNNDKTIDVNDIYDSAFAAANMAKGSGATDSTPLGDINKPFVPNTLLYYSATYNWGIGNLERNTTQDSALNAAPQETQIYLKNVYSLISSGFTKSGNPNYGDPKAPDGLSSTPIDISLCGSDSSAIIRTAITYAWPEFHKPPYFNLKPEYSAAIDAAQAAGKYVGGGSHPGIDCGGFVTRVMQDSGADPNYGGGGNVISQSAYMRNNPDKYTEIFPKSTSDLLPGDIAISDSHTYMYVGVVSGFGSTIASSSYGGSSDSGSWRSPMAGAETPADPNYHWFRFK